MKEGNVTSLTSDVEVKGTIKFNKILKIDGKFEGEMITNDGEVVVGNTGIVKANVKVKNAIIEGHVDGNIMASDKVELKRKAQLIGDLKARTLVIEEGVVFVGKCNVNPDGFKAENANFKEGRKEERKD
ncbi:MAG: polymer-forming cytoskeletal protein [Candidatus Scalinduaceae bacterium]